MNYEFLATNQEAYTLFCCIPFYLASMLIVHNRNVNLSKKNKKKGNNNSRPIGFFVFAFLLLAIVPFIHFGAYWFTFDQFPNKYNEIPEWRNGYVVSIGIVFIVFALLTWLNIQLRGAKVLPSKDRTGWMP